MALRGNAAEPRFLAACEAVLGVRPPMAANTVSSTGACSILWLGPDEWLIVDAPGREAELVSRLRSSLAAIHSAVVDVSASRTVLELSGSHAVEVLAKAATLDFHPRAFPVGACAQTNIARTQGLIHRIGEHDFRIFVRASFARYLSQWFSDAMQQPA